MAGGRVRSIPTLLATERGALGCAGSSATLSTTYDGFSGFVAALVMFASALKGHSAVSQTWLPCPRCMLTKQAKQVVRTITTCQLGESGIHGVFNFSPMQPESMPRGAPCCLVRVAYIACWFGCKMGLDTRQLGLQEARRVHIHKISSSHLHAYNETHLLGFVVDVASFARGNVG
jgi:hypothetical protein